MTDKLLPCPFCGGEARIAGKDGYYAHVICLKCFAKSASRASGGTVELNEKVAAVWNTREGTPLSERICDNCAYFRKSYSGDGWKSWCIFSPCENQVQWCDTCKNFSVTENKGRWNK